jgi:hypothetical protein
MEKGVAEGISFLCMAIAAAFAGGFVLAYAMNNERSQNIRDPTFQEALQFTYSDQTDKNQYNQSYTCIRFVDDFVNNALNERYRCGYVEVEFLEAGHEVVCFDTSDRGLIFIEPQNDQIVTLAEGQLYLGRTILRVSISWPVVLLDYSFAAMLVPLVIIPQLSIAATLLAIAALKRKRVN